MSAEKRDRLQRTVFPLLHCVRCSKSSLELSAQRIECRECSQAYPVHEDIPIMTLEPDAALSYSKSVVVENAYSDQWLALIRRAGARAVLDLGAGNNPALFDHVLKMDVFAMPNVD